MNLSVGLSHRLQKKPRKEVKKEREKVVPLLGQNNPPNPQTNLKIAKTICRFVFAGVDAYEAANLWRAGNP